MQYLEEIIWFSIWPVLIYIALKFVEHNIRHFNKLERLQKYEEKYGPIE